MRLASLFSFTRTLKPSWEYAPGASIWRMIPTSDGHLIGESRDEGAKKVDFFSIELSTGKPVWEHKEAGEDWWIGVDVVLEDVVLLHLFARPDMPEHAGLVALDRKTGTVLWKKPEVQLRGCRTGAIVVRRQGSSEEDETLLHPTSGDMLDAADIPESSEGTGFRDPEGVIYPVPVDQGSPGWELFRRVLGRRTLIGMCEAVQVEDRWIFSYHATEEESSPGPFTHEIAIMDDAGRTLFKDVLHESAHMPVYDAFFVQHQRVHYIRREKKLVCVDVSTVQGRS